jgi:acid phosphatase
MNAMTFAQVRSIEPRIQIFKKGIRPLKKQVALLATAFLVAIAPTFLTAQQPSAQPADKFSTYAPAESITNIDTLKGQLKQYHECTCSCGCYAKDLDLQADKAIAFLGQRAPKRGSPAKLALVLDIDETTLSNYEETVKADFTYDKSAFNVWVESAKAPAIAGTLRLYNEAQRLGVSVFFITGRPEAQRAVTEQNLRSQGFQNWQELIMRTSAQASATASAYKPVARTTILEKRYKIVLNVGDQWSDLKGTPEAEFSVKYPDPFYFIR